MATDAESLGFELLPADDQFIDEDDDLAAAVTEALSDDPVLTVTEEAPNAIGHGWAYDFDAGEFKMYGTEPVAMAGQDQLEFWIENTLRTARFAHTVHTENYGTERPYDLIGTTNPLVLAELYGTNIKASLTRHDRITTVKDITVEFDSLIATAIIGCTVVVDDQTELTYTGLETVL